MRLTELGLSCSLLLEIGSVIGECRSGHCFRRERMFFLTTLLPEWTHTKQQNGADR